MHEVLVILETALCVNIEDAKSDHLPCKLVERRQKVVGQMIFVNKAIFDCVILLENEIFHTYLCDSAYKLIAVLKDEFYNILRHEVDNHFTKLLIKEMIINSLLKISFCSNGADEMDEDDSIDGSDGEELIDTRLISTIANEFVDKLYDHYYNTIITDFMSRIKEKLTKPTTKLQKVNFRLSVLLNIIEKDECDS